MTKLRSIIFRAENGTLISTTEIPEGKAPEWIQVFPLKRFEVVPEGGEEDITVERLNEIIANFEAQGTDILIDADHEFGIAFGWGKEMEIRTGLEVKDGVDPNGLWARVVWNDSGKAAVENREYRYISPSFNKNWIDPEDGKSKGWRVLTFSLTNLPFYDSMQELIAASINKRTAGESNMEELKKVLGLPATATDAEILTAVQALMTATDDIVKVAEEIKDAVDLPADQSADTITASLKDRMKRVPAVQMLLRSMAEQAKQLTAVRDGLQLPKESTAKDIIERSKPTGDAETVVLRDKVKSLEASELMRNQEAIVARAKAEGRVLASDEKTQKFLREMVEKRGFTETDAYLGTMPVNAALVTKRGKPPLNLDDVVPTEDIKQFAERIGVDAAKLAKRQSSILEAVSR